MSQFDCNLQTARQLDRQDPLARFRDDFHIPQWDGRPEIYLVGNSLGLQPKATADFVNASSSVLLCASA